MSISSVSLTASLHPHISTTLTCFPQSTRRAPFCPTPSPSSKDVRYFIWLTARPTSPADLERLQQLLANRGEHACLGVVRPGSLDLYPINLDRQALRNADFRTIEALSSARQCFFRRWQPARIDLDGRPEKADYVFETIHDLLTAASHALAGTSGKQGHLPGLDVLSTTGRALFFRFLVDRRIVLESEVERFARRYRTSRYFFDRPSCGGYVDAGSMKHLMAICCR